MDGNMALGTLEDPDVLYEHVLHLVRGGVRWLDERAEEVVPEENYRRLLMAIYTTCDDFSAAVFSYI